jgi:hypothetical protein
MLVAAFAMALVLPLILVAVLFLGGEELSPSGRALDEIPHDLIPLYQAAASRCEGLNWTVLAAVHKVETSFGRGSATSSAGAQGPMQFMPETWRAYAADGDGDGTADINELEDSVVAAAGMLCANGAGDPARLSSALWNYNHSEAYVAEVIDLAAGYGVVTHDPGAALAQTSPSEVLGNPRIVLTGQARADIAQGLVDPRVIAILSAAGNYYTLGISTIKSGHSMYTRNGSVSLHYSGRAVDIYMVNGVPVSASSPSAESLVRWLNSIRTPAPTELGHPFASIAGGANFTDTDHKYHIHIGV